MRRARALSSIQLCIGTLCSGCGTPTDKATIGFQAPRSCGAGAWPKVPQDRQVISSNATRQCPATNSSSKQTVLGSAAGIALLLFALAYRFLPSFGALAAATERRRRRPPARRCGAVLIAQAQKPAPSAPDQARSSRTRWTRLRCRTADQPAPPPPKAIAALLQEGRQGVGRRAPARAEGHQRAGAVPPGARCRPGKRRGEGRDGKNPRCHFCSKPAMRSIAMTKTNPRARSRCSQDLPRSMIEHIAGTAGAR